MTLVLTCAVVGLPDADLGQRVHAVVQVTGKVSAEDLSAFVNQRWERVAAPSRGIRCGTLHHVIVTIKSDGADRTHQGRVRHRGLELGRRLLL